VKLGSTSSLYSDFFYRNDRGEDVVTRVTSAASAVYLYDYDGSGFGRISYYLPEAMATDTFHTAKVAYSGSINDISVVVTSSAVTYVKPGDFDLGGEGVGFHDSNTNHDPGSGGADYRTNLGDYLSAAMDIEGSGGNIGFTNNGEWLMYTVYVQDEGDYEIDWYISVNGGGAACHIEVDGNASPVYILTNNANWSDWRYYCEREGIAAPVYHLTVGKHKIMYYWNGGDFNYNGLRITHK
jgi:hypothetical protein